MDRIFADRRLTTIFAILFFGAAIVLMAVRAEARVNALFACALCGTLVYPLRRQAPRELPGLGLSLPRWPEAARAEFTASVWQPTPEILETELATCRGERLEQQPARAARAFAAETLLLVARGICRAGCPMLVGLSLFRSGTLGAERSPRL